MEQHIMHFERPNHLIKCVLNRISELIDQILLFHAFGFQLNVLSCQKTINTDVTTISCTKPLKS